jgi:hypothetical protein
MDKEARELQIKLAQLQTDIRIYTSAVFGFIALSVASLVAGYQFGLEGMATNDNLKVFLGIFFLILTFVFAWATRRCYKGLLFCRDELYNLK